MSVVLVPDSTPSNGRLGVAWGVGNQLVVHPRHGKAPPLASLDQPPLHRVRGAGEVSPQSGQRGARAARRVLGGRRQVHPPGEAGAGQESHQAPPKVLH